MDAIDPRLHSYLVSQGLVRPPQREDAPAPARPAATDGFQTSGVESPGLVPRLEARPQKAPAPTSGAPEFRFDHDRESLQRMDALRREGLDDELRQIRKQLKPHRRDGTLAERAQVHATLQDVGTSLDRMEVARRAGRWDEVASAVDGPVSDTYRSYFLNGKTPIGEMQEVLRTAQSLADPDSPMRSRGNDVRPLVRGEVWQAKMERVEEAARQPVQDGRPVEIDAEYYELSSPEMLEKLSRASRGGANVRVLMDPGQVSRMSGTPDATSLASRLNTLKRLEDGSGGRAAVQLFANKEVLGGKDEIMHRKLLRVGDTVIFGGMNANSGSGENVDFGMELRGPVAGEFVETFRSDVELSRGRDARAIYGGHLQDLRESEDVEVRAYGLLDLMESQISGPPRAGEPYAQRVDRVLESASYQGLQASDLAVLPEGVSARDYLLRAPGPVPLTERGRNLLADGLEAAVDRINRPENQERLREIQAPDTSRAGGETVAVGDSSVERQAMVLHAIDSAERHVKVSAFVLNEDMARLLAEKKQRMEAQGRPFDVQVVLDPGVYPFGGSPNERAHRLLEDSGVQVRWAALDRSNEHHDRKVHAKVMITDKMVVAGSTNFSHKGLRDNWELTDVTFFTDNPESRADQEKVEADFARLWERESLALDTRAVAERRHGSGSGLEAEYLRDDTRTRTLRRFLRGIGELEQDIGRQVDELKKGDPVLSYTVEQKVREGASRGYATLEAVGEERLAEIRHRSPRWRELVEISQG